MAFRIGGNIECGSNCLTDKCRRIRKCACKGGSLKALGRSGPVLYDGFVDACANNADLTTEDYLCKQIGPSTLFTQFGVLRCGYNPTTDSPEGQIYLDQLEAAEKSDTGQQKTIGYFAIGIIALIVVLLFSAKSKPAK